MKAWISYSILFLLLSGCALKMPATGGAPGAPQAAATALTTPGAVPSAAIAAQTATSTPALTGDVPTMNATIMTQTSGKLSVEVFSEQDVEVSVPTYQVSGQAPEGTVLSVNEAILVVDPSQTFSTQVSLEDGPNLIEIVASDVEGNAVDFMLTVTYNNQE